MILTNELPHFRDSSGALAGRLLLLTMRESFFGKEDTHLKNKLLQELAGILLWAIEGWRRLRDRGHFEQPKSGVELIGQLEELASPVMAFVRDYCDVTPGASCSVETLFSAWQIWHRKEGTPDHQVPVKSVMSRDLLAALLRKITVKQPRNEDGTRQRTYYGIRVKDGVISKPEPSTNGEWSP